MSTGSKNRSAKEQGKIRALPQLESSFVKVSGEEHGCGPFYVAYNNVSPQLVIVLESVLQFLKDQIFEMVQKGNGQKEGTKDGA